MFLGVLVSRTNLGNKGWIVLIAFYVWIFCLVVSIELMQLLFEDKNKKGKHIFALNQNRFFL